MRPRLLFQKKQADKEGAPWKVCVYAICKNESQFVERWMASMGEADAVVVLDTGSTDDTAESLRAAGARVTVERFDPWRFDTARNRSLDLVPEDADICVCTDLDEVLHPGWRALLEAAWVPGTTRATYRYTWNFLPDGREGHVFWYRQGTRPPRLPLDPPRARGAHPGPGPGGARGHRAGDAAGPPRGREQVPGAIPAAAGIVRAGGPGGRPQHALPGPGIHVPGPVGKGHRHPETAPVPAPGHLAG